MSFRALRGRQLVFSFLDIQYKNILENSKIYRPNIAKDVKLEIKLHLIRRIHMEKTEAITLRLLTEAYIDDLNQFELLEEQHKFTALPKEISDLTEGQYGVMIMNYEEPVGFFLLHQTDRVKEYSENHKAILLTALSINQVHQRKGYARKGMIILAEFVKDVFPECDEIVLAVNHRNIPAQKLYHNVGFADTGKRKEGPKGEQYIMALQAF